MFNSRSWPRGRLGHLPNQAGQPCLSGHLLPPTRPPVWPRPWGGASLDARSVPRAPLETYPRHLAPDSNFHDSLRCSSLPGSVQVSPCELLLGATVSPPLQCPPFLASGAVGGSLCTFWPCSGLKHFSKEPTSVQN